MPVVVEAWAMLFQMMDRLHANLAKRDFASIHVEEAVTRSAVSDLLSELANSRKPNVGITRFAWLTFVRDVSDLHIAVDAGHADACAELLQRVDDQFRKLEKDADPNVLRAAHQYAGRFTCPMHPDVIGSKDETCAKCGMPLDQLVVLWPGREMQASVRATISTDAPLEVGKLARATLHLRRADDEPVTLAELIETHTKKIHLLIVDQSLTDYHHEHPQPTDTPGDYAFNFIPRKPGSYLAWADLRPTPLGLQEYEKTVIAGTGKSEALTDKESRFVGDADGLHFELSLAQPEIKVGVPVRAKLRITKPDGSGFKQLEPVMGAFAHLVGFNEDTETVLHMHPIGPPISREDERGGPELDFKIFTTKAGFVRLFSQVQIDGRQVFVPFGIRVVP